MKSLFSIRKFLYRRLRKKITKEISEEYFDMIERMDYQINSLRKQLLNNEKIHSEYITKLRKYYDSKVNQLDGYYHKQLERKKKELQREIDIYEIGIKDNAESFMKYELKILELQQSKEQFDMINAQLAMTRAAGANADKVANKILKEKRK